MRWMSEAQAQAAARIIEFKPNVKQVLFTGKAAVRRFRRCAGRRKELEH